MSNSFVFIYFGASAENERPTLLFPISNLFVCLFIWQCFCRLQYFFSREVRILSDHKTLPCVILSLVAPNKSTGYRLMRDSIVRLKVEYYICCIYLYMSWRFWGKHFWIQPHIVKASAVPIYWHLYQVYLLRRSVGATTAIQPMLLT